jgi:hypothetical protein
MADLYQVKKAPERFGFVQANAKGKFVRLQTEEVKFGLSE